MMQCMSRIPFCCRKSKKIKIYHKVETNVLAKSAKKPAEIEKKTASLQFVHILITIPQKL